MRRFQYLAAIIISTLTFGAPQLALGDVLINVNKATQRLTVTVDGAEMYHWPVSTARPGYVTPNGIYRPVRLDRTWFSKKYHNAPMPYSIFFHGGYAIHGSYEARDIGHPASHGCIRLHPANARILFKLVKAEGQNNTRIVIEGPAPSAHQGEARSTYAPTPARYDRQWRGRTNYIRLVDGNRTRARIEPPYQLRPRIYFARPRKFVGPFEELFSYIQTHGE